MRTEPQAYWDATAILRLFDCVNKSYNIDGNLKIQKLTFLYELQGRERNLRAAHYRFFRFTHGPYSKALANDVNALKARGFLNRRNQLTDRGKFVVGYVGPFFNGSEARQSEEALERVCAEYGRFSGLQLRSKVYRMVVPVIDCGNQPQKVLDIEPYTDILDPLREADLKEVSPFPEDILNDLKSEFAMAPEALDPHNAGTRQEVIERLEAIHSIA